jgi:Flp pilus assembly protein TadG
MNQRVARRTDLQTRRQSQMSRTTPNFQTSFVHSTRASAAIEFAITASLLFFPFLGAAEIGYSAYQAMQVQSAAEAGALYSSKNAFDASKISSAVVSATGVTGLAASPASVQFCGCPNSSAIATVICTAKCADGTSPGTYIRISATLTRKSLIPNSGLVLPSTLLAKSIVRTN